MIVKILFKIKEYTKILDRGGSRDNRVSKTVVIAKNISLPEVGHKALFINVKSHRVNNTPVID
jgi:hypothetical protein